MWDDDAHVTDNAPLYEHAGQIAQLWTQPGLVQQYYPLTYSAFALEYRLWGTHTLPYHLVNLFLHGLNAFLLGCLLIQLEISGAWYAAFLFALHPVCVETVAWISELKNLLSAFFFLLALRRYCRFEDSSRPRDYAMAFLFYFAALFSKTVACTFPAVVLLLLWWKKGLPSGRTYFQRTPFAVAGLIFGLITAWLERTSIGAVGAGWHLSPFQHLTLAARIVCFYAGKIIWPHPLIFLYPRWDPYATANVFYLIALFAVLGAFAFGARQGKRGLLAAALIFMSLLFPALGFFRVYPMRFSFVADHFQYMACAVVIVVIGSWLARLRPFGRSRSRGAGWNACLVLLACALAVQSRSQAALYQSNAVLWQATAEKNPNSPAALNNWAGELIKAGQDNAAIPVLERALALDPDYSEVALNLAEEYRAQGKTQDAVALYQSAIRREPASPLLHYRLALLWQAAGDGARARTEYRQVTLLMPAQLARRWPYAQRRRWQALAAHAHDQLAEGFLQDHAYPSAEGELKAALSLEPDAAPLHLHLALVLTQEGKIENAIEEYQRALALNNSSAQAHYNLAGLLWSQKRVTEAREHFASAKALDPHFNNGRKYRR